MLFHTLLPLILTIPVSFCNPISSVKRPALILPSFGSDIDSCRHESEFEFETKIDLDALITEYGPDSEEADSTSGLGNDPGPGIALHEQLTMGRRAYIQDWIDDLDGTRLSIGVTRDYKATRPYDENHLQAQQSVHRSVETRQRSPLTTCTDKWQAEKRKLEKTEREMKLREKKEREKKEREQKESPKVAWWDSLRKLARPEHNDKALPPLPCEYKDQISVILSIPRKCEFIELEDLEVLPSPTVLVGARAHEIYVRRYPHFVRSSRLDTITERSNSVGSRY